MPRVRSSYRAPLLLRNAHVHTVYPALMRKVHGVVYMRERLELPDGDFLDLDWVRHRGDSRLAILCHGLESGSNAQYMRGMTRLLSDQGWDVLALNYRGCSGEENRLPRSYHSGATEDLDAVMAYVQGLERYTQLALVGFSLGGNLVLKYLGEGRPLAAQVNVAACVSVPCDLASSAERLGSLQCRIYMRFFANSLKEKLLQKSKRFPGTFCEGVGEPVRSFAAFDRWYTAPAHGFLSAQDYWTRCSSRPYLAQMKTPTLLLSAQDDPFLPNACYPEEEAAGSSFLYLETPRHGGHLGFVGPRRNASYWHEIRIGQFLASFIH